jgi:Ca2+-binding EF-hand superfamily protein
MTPMDLFVLFDEDDSGLISFQEYRKMLPMLDVQISDAKAYRYFKMCDTVRQELRVDYIFITYQLPS